VFREVRRVLADTGTLWLNLGDSYSSNPKGTGGDERSTLSPSGTRVQRDRHLAAGRVPGVKVKDLVGVPWRVAFALQADGWYLRSDIIWAKPNPMPESTTDRPTKSHEYVFLLSKQPRYFFNQEAVREDFADDRMGANGLRDGTAEAHARAAGRGGDQGLSSFNRGATPGRTPQAETLDGSNGEAPRGPDGRRATHIQGADGSIQHRDGERWPNSGRNIRTVWEIPTQPYPDAHFATFPEELVRRCIAAGCPEGGTVLDPFLGSGTVALVARKQGRRSVGIELSPEYCALAARRLQQLSLLA
jgi:DNA modification methylase